MPKPQTKLIDRVTIRSPRTLLAVTTVSAFLLRALFAVINFRDIPTASPNFGTFGAEMGWVARSIVTGHGFTSPFWPVTGATALVPPLYPYLLAGVFRVFGLYTVQSSLAILLIQSLFSALTCIPIYLTVKESAGERTAQLAAWLWVVYPFSIFYGATQVWDYAQTSFLFALCFYFAQRLPSQKLIGWFGFGLLYGVTVLSNPSVLSLLPFLLLIALWKSRQQNWFLRGALTTIAFFLVITPWNIRDQRVLHTAVPIRDGFWLEFWAGNHGDTSSSNPPAAHPATNDYEMQLYQSQGEIAYLAGKHVLAVEFVRQHPGYFVAVCLRRVFRFWTGVWSFSPSYLRDQILDVPNFFFCTCITFFMLRGIRRWWRVAPDDVMPYLIVVLLFPITYYLSHASMDYRQPIESQIVILAAVGAFGLTTRPRTIE
ncbi:MAG TPA: glycosyltransferase family 39 protein [Acidobacteriaceae bacterium]|jgi:4-amino-4-deoxy-L-arabinose transferase-like glycosyltransferase|nr:glycosyltransferase family 39 protein [Acidobacteriaceae bacterium]